MRSTAELTRRLALASLVLIAAPGAGGDPLPALLLVGGLLYFLPAGVAAMRGHHQRGAIYVIDIFLGWTLVGWVVALAMAMSQVKPPPDGAKPQAPYPLE